MGEENAEELLFFDTFAHESNEELNLDLVQFPKPVCISQVRVIPLGAKVQADFPGGVRLGATNPSQFQLELFVNDLSKPGASSFETLGVLDYKQNATIQYECIKKVPTDGLVLRGWYTTVTLSVYGWLTSVIIPRAPTPPPIAVPQPPTPPVEPAPAVPPSEITPVASVPEPVKSEIPPVPLKEEVNELLPPVPEGKCDIADQGKVKEEIAKPEKEHEPEREREKDRDKDRYRERERERDRERDRDRDKFRDRERERDRGRKRERSPSEAPRESCKRDGSRSRDKSRDRPPRESERSEEKRRPRTPPPPPTRSPEEQLKESAEAHKASKEGEAPFIILSAGDVEAISDDEMLEMEPVEDSPVEKNDKEKDSSEAEVKSKVVEEKEVDTVETVEPVAEQEEDMEPEDFEEIVSDEDLTFEDEYMDVDLSEYADEFGKPFNPYGFEVQPLQYLYDPSMTPYAVTLHRLQANWPGVEENGKVAADKLENLLTLPLEEFDKIQGRGEKFVEGCEQLASVLGTGLAYLNYKKHSTDVENLIVKWLNTAIDFETALLQPQPVFKVRHLKAGLKLASAAVSASPTLLRQTLNAGLQTKLLNLYEAPHMAISLKLACIRALDRALSCLMGMEHFLHSTDPKGYVRLLGFVQSPQTTRAKVAVAAVLQKMHFYEALVKLKSLTDAVLELPIPQFKRPDDRVRRDSNDWPESDSQDGFGNAQHENTLEPYMTDLLACFDQIVQVYAYPQSTIAPPHRFLPAKAQFELPPAGDTYPAIYALLKAKKFLEACLVLLSHPVAFSRPALQEKILNWFELASQSQHGLTFLASQPEVMTAILKTLFQSQGEEKDEFGNAEDALQLNAACQKTGLALTHSLYVVQCIDALQQELQSQEQPLLVDEPPLLDIVQSLHSFLFSQTGRLALCHTVTLEDNVAPLLQLLKSPHADLEAKLQNSATRGYVIDVIAYVVRFSERVPFLQKHGPSLLTIVQQQPPDEYHNSKLASLLPWLELTQNAELFSYAGLTALTELLKTHTEDVVTVSPEAIVVLRIMAHLVTEPGHKFLSPPEDTCKELKYAYAVAQFFASDVMGILQPMLLKLCQCFDPPSQHVGALVGPQGALLISLLHPALHIFRQLWCQVIKCRGSEFQDLSPIPVLLQTHALLQAVPSHSMWQSKVQETCSDIVATLLAYTQPIPQQGIDMAATILEDVLAKSLWTLMVQEIFKYVNSGPGPASYFTGLQVLSELLPLPLPLLTSSPLSEDEIAKTRSQRKVWSAHLHNLAPQIHDVVGLLSCTGCGPLLHLVRRVCVQLADLAPSTALVVLRAVLDSILGSLAQDANEVKLTKVAEDKEEPNVLPSSVVCSAVTVRWLNFLACLIGHAVFKAAFLQLARGAQKTDEKYVEILPWFGVILNSPCPEQTFHVQGQECVVSIMQSLCDSEICLLPQDTTTTLAEVYLSCALPSKDQLTQIIQGLLKHLSKAEHSYASLLPTLRTLTMLTEHNFTFYHLQKSIEKRSQTFATLLQKVSAGFSKDSSDCLSTLSTALELFRLLVKCPLYVSNMPSRTLCMKSEALASALGWEGATEKSSVEGKGEEGKPSQEEEEDKSKHALEVLDQLLAAHSTEEESMEGLRETVSSLLRLLQNKEQSAAPTEAGLPDVELSMPPAESLANQYASRSVFSLLEPGTSHSEDERLSSAYWLSVHTDDHDGEVEQVRCDLVELAKTYLEDWDLAGEVEKLCSHQALNTTRALGAVSQPTRAERHIKVKSGTKKVAREEDKAVAPTIVSTVSDKVGKPYVAPMRGRGFGRSGVGSRPDVFRSRAPNTSRPPSLHVDDFVALESGSATSNAYKAGLGRVNKETLRGRGRGSRGYSERGRFSAIPQRRDVTRGVPMPIPRSVNRVWTAPGREVPATQTASSRTYRSPEPRRLEERFQRSPRASPPVYRAGKERERFPASLAREKNRREVVRHARTFTR